MDKNRAIYRQRRRRKWRVRRDITGTTARPRLCVFRSHKHISCQIIDDTTGVTLVSAGTHQHDLDTPAAYGVNKSAAELIGVPFVKADATKFSETGYVGADVDDLVRDLIRRANGDLNRASLGIIYVDEVDKLATQEGTGRDVSGKGVQTNLLKLMEDADVPVLSPNDITGQVQGAMAVARGGAASSDTINTRHILFIASGAFAGLADLIRTRLAREGALGTQAPPIPNAAAIYDQAQTLDFITYGFEPEFIGRLPVRVACHGLTEKDLFDVLKRSESSLIHQYVRAFGAYGIRLSFRTDGLRRIAHLASTENTGARGLMTICERIFRDLKFELPSSLVKEVVVTRTLVEQPAEALADLLNSERQNK